MEDECEVRSFEEIKIQGKGIEVEAHDLGGPLAPDLEKLRKKNPHLADNLAKNSERRRRREEVDEKRCLPYWTMTRL